MSDTLETAVRIEVRASLVSDTLETAVRIEVHLIRVSDTLRKPAAQVSDTLER